MTLEFFPLFPPSTHFNIPMPDANRVLRTLSRNGTLKSVHTTYGMIMECLETVLPIANTYNAMRGDINTLCNWAWLIKQKDIIDLSLADMNEFISFANNPPLELIGSFSSSVIDQKQSDDTYLVANALWKPFVNRTPQKQYKRTEQSLKAQLSNLSYMFTYFEDVEFAFKNPAAVALRRLSSAVKKDLRHDRSEMKHKGLSTLQTNYLFKAVELMAKESPKKHERTRFIIYLMVFCYPRISEVCARSGYSPIMGDFEEHRAFNDNETYYSYYIPNSKGGKTRKVICAPILIEALKRYRQSRGLGYSFPTPDEDSPLFVRHRAATRGREASVVDANLGIDHMGDIIQEVYEKTGDLLLEDGFDVESRLIRTMTPHSLRHTGITIDLSSGRDPHHVMLDAGHSSEATLAVYTSKRTEHRAASINKKSAFLQSVIKPNHQTALVDD